jgi:hypothetical protein
VTAVVCIVVGAVVGPMVWSAIQAGSWSVFRLGLLPLLGVLLDLRVLAWIGLGSVAAVVRLR